MKTHIHFSGIMKKAAMMAATLTLGVGVYAQDAAGAAPKQVMVPASYFSMLVGLLVIIAVLLAYITVVLAVRNPEVLSLGYWGRSITGRGSDDKMLDHAYDGIKELDNPMPAWLRLILWGSVVWGAIYLFYFHVMDAGQLQEAEYKSDMAAAAEKYGKMELPDDRIVVLTDASALDKAHTLFVQNCATCHGEKGEGKSGPNLTDAYWLHGGSVKDIYKTITAGVPGKAMVPWKDRVNSPDRLALASYILSLQGSNPPGGLKPDGVLYSPEGAVQEPAPAGDSAQVADTLK